MKRATFTIDDDTNFTTIDGEIFGIGGDSDFIKTLTAAANFLLNEPAAVSCTLVSGHTIKLIDHDS